MSRSRNRNIKIKIRLFFGFYVPFIRAELAKKQAEDATKRTSQVSSGDRSAKIRTYMSTLKVVLRISV
jgi:protein subunit release factor A